ncbi:MAG: HD domain-containing protein [Patescibacteria group bacterium]
MDNTKSLIERAKEFATMAHEGQFRLGKKKEPFIAHPALVASLVCLSEGRIVAQIAAAWLHDVVEDASNGDRVGMHKTIRKLFGKTVAEIVDGLTDPPEFEGLPLLERKALQAERVATKSAGVKRVKLADQIANVTSLATDPPIKWSLEERRNYLDGARLVAEQCAGISLFLDNTWTRAYAKTEEALEKRRLTGE